jgi:hypothetical protein
MNTEEPSKSGISLIRISNEKEILCHGIDQIAQQLWGGPVTRQFPLYLVLYEGRICGFFQAIEQTCIFPAIHPEFISPRTFLKVAKSLATELKRHIGNPLFLLCPKAEEIGEKGMRMIRLKKAKETCYVYDEGG